MHQLKYFGINTDVTSYQKKTSINELANQVIKTISPYATKIMIAGSIRRGVPANDIDIVLIPKDKIKIQYTVEKMGGRIYASGPKQLYFKYKGVDVNLYYADHQDYGAQLLTRTGSAGHNIGLRRLAQKKGLTLNQYGLYKDDKRIAGRTEREIYTALNRPRFKGPEERQ